MKNISVDINGNNYQQSPTLELMVTHTSHSPHLTPRIKGYTFLQKVAGHSPTSGTKGKISFIGETTHAPPLTNRTSSHLL